MPYTTHPFYTVTYNQPGSSAWGRDIVQLLALNLSSAIILDFCKLVEDDA